MSGESAGLRFLYETKAGRCLLKLLVRPGLSRLAGRFLDSRASRLLIPGFRRSYQISTENIEIPAGGFPSFNSFFCRKRLRCLVEPSPERLVSPCDGLLSVYPIAEDSRFAIKHSTYSVTELLEDAALAAEFSGGTALIFRLTPAHYHRYIYVDDGVVLRTKKIPGVLHTVRPIAVERTAVYVQNSREYALLQTEHFGSMVQMEIGAMLVGRITNPPTTGFVTRGQERGWFEYGGSTIVLLLRKDAAALLPAFSAEEIPVTLGQWIGNQK